MKKLILTEKPKKEQKMGQQLRLMRRANEREIKEIIKMIENVKDCETR